MNVLTAVFEFLSESGICCVMHKTHTHDPKVIYIDHSDNIKDSYSVLYATVYFYRSTNHVHVLWWGASNRGDKKYCLEDPNCFDAIVVEIRDGFAKPVEVLSGS